jgi:hypothetical protein
MLKTIKNLFSRYAFVSICLISILCSLIICLIYQRKAIVIWDEGYFIYCIYQVIDSIKAHDWNQFFALSKSFYQYPPLFNWIFAFPLSFIGKSIELIRGFSVIFYIGSAILTYILAEMVAVSHKKIVAVLAALFFMFSPMVIIFATFLMRELSGAMFSLLAAILYIKFRKQHQYYLCIVSLSLIMVFFIKYNYGAIVYVAIVLNELFDWIINRKKFTYILANIVLLSIPVFIVMFWWIMIYQNDLTKFIGVLANATDASYFNDIGGNKLDYLFFYPFSLISMYSFSQPLGVILLGLFMSGISKLKSSNLRFIWIIAFVNISLGIIHKENIQERYILTVIPFYFIFGAYMLVHISNYLIIFTKNIILKYILFGIYSIFIFIVVFDLIHLPSFIYSVGSYVMKSPVFNQSKYKTQYFVYNPKEWFFPIAPDNADKPYDVFTMIATTIDVTKPLIILSETNELSSDYRNIIFADYYAKGLSPKTNYRDYGIILELDKSSKLYSHDYIKHNQWRMMYRWQIENDPSYIKIKTRRYPDLGLTVTIYAR